MDKTGLSKIKRQISICLWFDHEAEEAARYYTSVFRPRSKITAIRKYRESEPGPEGGVMTVSFELEGQKFEAINGTSQFKPSKHTSFVVYCDTQGEVDRFWKELSRGGQQGPCGSVRDRYGILWQIVPTTLGDMLNDKAIKKSKRVEKKFLEMKKPRIGALKKALHQNE